MTEKATLADLSQAAAELANKIRSLGRSREASLALTNLQQSVMWAREAIESAPGNG